MFSKIKGEEMTPQNVARTVLAVAMTLMVGIVIYAYSVIYRDHAFKDLAQPVVAMAIQRVQVPPWNTRTLGNEPKEIQNLLDLGFCYWYCFENHLSPKAYVNNFAFDEKQMPNFVQKVDLIIYPSGAQPEKPKYGYQKNDGRLGRVEIWFNEDRSVRSVVYVRKMG